MPQGDVPESFVQGLCLVHLCTKQILSYVDSLMHSYLNTNTKVVSIFNFRNPELNPNFDLYNKNSFQFWASQSKSFICIHLQDFSAHLVASVHSINDFWLNTVNNRHQLLQKNHSSVHTKQYQLQHGVERIFHRKNFVFTSSTWHEG